MIKNLNRKQNSVSALKKSGDFMYYFVIFEIDDEFIKKFGLLGSSKCFEVGKICLS